MKETRPRGWGGVLSPDTPWLLLSRPNGPAADTCTKGSQLFQPYFWQASKSDLVGEDLKVGGEGDGWLRGEGGGVKGGYGQDTLYTCMGLLKNKPKLLS